MTAELHQALMLLLERRRFTHNFNPEPLPEHLLDWLREAVRQVPSAAHEQGLRCVFMTKPAEIAALAAKAEEAFKAFLNSLESRFVREEAERHAGTLAWLGQAPALAVLTVKRPPDFLQEALGELAAVFFGAEASAAIAVQNLFLAAESLGLGVCPVAAPLACGDELEDFLGLDSREHKLVHLVALGRKRQEGW